VADVASAERVACHASRRTLFQTGEEETHRVLMLTGATSPIAASHEMPVSFLLTGP